MVNQPSIAKFFFKTTDNFTTGPNVESTISVPSQNASIESLSNTFSDTNLSDASISSNTELNAISTSFADTENNAISVSFVDTGNNSPTVSSVNNHICTNNFVISDPLSVNPMETDPQPITGYNQASISEPSIPTLPISLPDTFRQQNTNNVNVKSILKNPQNVDPTNIHTKSVIFQNKVKIPERILPSWRRARSALANAAKARLRAHHYQVLRTLNQPTLWAIGVGKFPHFLKLDTEAKDQLVQASRAHAMVNMNIVQNNLTRLSEAEGSLGATFRTATVEMYGGETIAQPALDLLTNLVDKEKASTVTTLNTRVANLQANPISDIYIITTMVPDPDSAHNQAPPTYIQR